MAPFHSQESKGQEVTAQPAVKKIENTVKGKLTIEVKISGDRERLSWSTSVTSKDLDINIEDLMVHFNDKPDLLNIDNHVLAHFEDVSNYVKDEG